MKRAIVNGEEYFDERTKTNYVRFKLLEDGEQVFKKIEFDNYMYIAQEDEPFLTSQHLRYVKRTEDVVDSEGEEYLKLIFKNNSHRYYLKKQLEEDSITHYEADIHAFKRFLIHNQQVNMNQDKLRSVAIDIETDDRGEFHTDNRGNVIANSPILSIAFKDMNGKTEFFYNNARDSDIAERYRNNRQDPDIKQEFDKELFRCEKALLKEIYEYLDGNYEVTLSWNGWRFDIPYLKQRFELHSMDFESLFSIDLDYMELYKKNTWENLKSFSLQYVSEHEFENSDLTEEQQEEVGKIDWKEKTDLDMYFDLYLYEPEMLEEYNIQDVNLICMIEDKYNFMHTQAIISEICHAPVSQTLHNSKVFDYSMMNEYHNEDIVAPSKPSYQDMEERKNTYISGGYTYVYEPGLHRDLECFDFKSFYPTCSVTYNISPETFEKELYPRLETVFTEKEQEFVEYATTISQKFVNHRNRLKSKKYNKALKKKQEELGVPSMKELMFKFTEEYKDEELIKYCEENGYVFTPADINLDTRGWNIHPHRLFSREKEGIFPKLNREFITERDKIKYQLKKLEKGTDEYQEKDAYQTALKILANSGYGAFGFRSFRFFMKEMGDTITSACRYTMKKSIIEAERHGLEVTHGDTDSSYLKNETDLSIDEIEKIFYDFYNEMIKEYNTICNVKFVNPHTGELEEHDHFIVYEHEKTFESCIVVKKKRYYYKEKRNGKPVYGTQGGAYKKTNTNPWAAELQEELCKDILDGTYDREEWYKKIKSIREDVYNYKMDEELLIMNKGLNRPVDTYGKPMIDGKTGEPKKNKDGSIRHAPVPVHVKLAKEMIDNGKEVSAGDKINYIVVDTGPQDAITIEDFRENPRYDCDYYYERIESPLIEILEVVEGLETYDYFTDCWTHSERVQKRLRRELVERVPDEEFDDEEDD